MKKTALIMAGGRGERFWPRSRQKLPKQFLPLTDDDKTMIQLTVERILPLVKLEDIYIATNVDYKLLVQEQLPSIPKENILCEPVSRNTAPCIGVCAMYISSKYDDALMMVLPSDHLIKFDSIFLTSIKDAIEVAECDMNLVTLGISPNYPETGYGYIKYKPSDSIGRAFSVERFVEKPNLQKAKEYISSNEYLWNSGMFIWKVSSILKNIEFFIPEIYQGLLKIKNAIGTPEEKFVFEKEFSMFPSVSIDFGIMEKAKHIYTIPGTFGWDDVGSWLAVERTKKPNEDGNIVDGNVITINSNECIIQGSKKLIATVGIKNLVVVDTEDATLICEKGSLADIKKVLETLKTYKRDEYI